MIDPDSAFDTLSKVYEDFGEFCQKRGQISEADTRAKVIDRILKEALGWPENAISREEHVNRGYIDYRIKSEGREHLIIEAKREGIPFDVPTSLQNRQRYKISGSIRTNDSIRDAVEQAQGYCVEIGTRYAVVTNGYAWLVFRAIIEGKPWREGDIIVFKSAGYIKKNFVQFWNLLSFQAVMGGSLDAAFAPDILRPRSLSRPIDHLRNPDAPLHRNRFHMQLHPFVENVFRDIGAVGQIKILRRCYVYNKTLRIVDKDLKLVIEDSLPRFLKAEGAMETTPGRQNGGSMGAAVQQAVEEGVGTLFLLLGGIGCGKTTFLKRFFTHVAQPFIDQNTIWTYIDFLGAPPASRDLELFLYKTILDRIRNQYAQLGLEKRESLKTAFHDKIVSLRDSFLDAERLQEVEYERRLSKYMEKWISDLTEYVPRIVRLAQKQGKVKVVCIDNVDQLSPEYQANIFLLAQRAVRQLEAVVIVALREESYYTASLQRAFTAYNNRKFHIASPPFRRLISSRIRYCQELLRLPEDVVLTELKAGIKFDHKVISKFLEIIQYSIFSKNRNIARFIEALSFGNMREALDMFATFLYSGATNVDKMLKICERDGQYFVAFHEFAKSIILGDRRYYRDSQSKILNVFDCGQERNSSHFTSIRLLALLLSHVTETSYEGRGFVTLEDVFNSFLDVFDNEQDLDRTTKRLLRKHLIELDTRSTSSLEGARFMRISSAGWYYFKYLIRAFAYLDLVFQDTPIDDQNVARTLAKYILDVDDIPETQDFMDERLSLRFERVGKFLDYLSKEEEKEREKFALHKHKTIIGEEILPGLLKQFYSERAWIEKRIREKTEQQPDDELLFDSRIVEIPISEEDSEQYELFDSENT